MRISVDISKRDEEVGARRTMSLARHSAQIDSRNASIVEDVIIPPHLLRAARTDHQAWQPQSTAQDSINHSDFLLPVTYYQTRDIPQGSALPHRTASVTIAGLSRSRATGFDTSANRFAVAPHNSDPRAPLYRKTSLPSIGEGLASTRNVAGAQSIRAAEPDTQSERSVLYAGFRDFSFLNSSSEHTSRTSLDEETDPTSLRREKEPNRQPSVDKTHNETHTRRISHVALPIPIQNVLQNVAEAVRKSSMYDMFEKAKNRGQYLQRQKWAQLLFEYSMYTLILAFIYLVLVGMPLWKGAVYWLWWVVEHKFVISGGFAITVGLASLYAFAPLLIFFESDPPMPSERSYDSLEKAYQSVHDTALMIPCYKSASLIANTLEAALKIFPASHIFVIANGNSLTPLDETEEVCARYDVNHVWCPIGSKIVAQFVGCYATKSFLNVLLIDDDCALPPNFPLVGDRMKGNVKCIGYTITSVGPNSTKGTLCQQAQDLEYKISGLQRAFAGKIGSATFPHGAISLWNRAFLLKTFQEHPGFSVSEDWFFGHVARKLGCRILMCTSVFVETETPSSVFFASGGSRGGFGEMTIFKQRFLRWNFFFVNGMWYNMAYIFGSWKLGWWEIGAKLFVFQEVYETLLYLLTPFILPISLAVRPSFCAYLLLGTIVLYLANVVVFNEIHLRRKNQRVGSVAVYLYYMPYKVVLTVVNVASCYWSLWKYARYFAQRHPKIIENEKAVEVVLRLEEQSPAVVLTSHNSIAGRNGRRGSRRMTVTSVRARISSVEPTANNHKFVP
jgi:hypothetical protein